MGWQDAPEVQQTQPAWASAPEVSQQKPVGTGEALLRGAAQGATLGFGDELEAGWKHLVGGADYTKTRDQLRADEANARSQHPIAYGAAEAVGGAVPFLAGAALTGGAASPLLAGRTALGVAAGQGALQGAGYSEGKNARSLARDTALGAGVGVAGYGLGQGLAAAGRGLARFARAGSTVAAARATEKAANEIAAEIASAKGSLGGEVQKGSRLVENLGRFGTKLGPEEQAAAAALAQRVEASNLQSLPGQAATIGAKDAELQALKTGASDALKSRTAELLSTAEAKRQLSARALRYGPVAAGTLIGTAIGGPVGSAVGALAGAGSRPMVRSTLRMLQNPAVQKAAYDKLAAAAESTPGALLRQLLARGAPAAATQSLVEP